MSVLLKNWLYQSKFLKRVASTLLILGLIFSYKAKSQKIGNYAVNGSFEEIYSCDPPYTLDKAKGWSSLGSDTSKFTGKLYSVSCFSNAPYTDGGFQYPKTGDKFFRSTSFCVTPCSYYFSRSYPKNRLKGTLVFNKTYCVKMYVCRENFCPHAVSDFGFYFGNTDIDTIKYSSGPITYLTPQVFNPTSFVITDTLNWTVISGTFVATGTEKYLVLGNFKSDAATTYSLVDNSYGSGVWSEYFIDDVSCIEVNLPAYAGPDKALIPGDSVYIGRELDFAVDSGCTWYKLPNMTTPIVKASGLWVKPTSTSTYVVKQILDCRPLKSDTVVVFMNPLGIISSSEVENDLKLFPMPSKDFVELSCNNSELLKEFNKLQIANQLGQILKVEEIKFENKPIKIKTDELPNGVYFITISTTQNECVTKKLVISK